MSHTSGPWYLSNLGHGSIVCSELATLLPPSEGLRHLDIIARTAWGRGEEDEANAQLIVAAPDLLAALEQIVEVLDSPELTEFWQSPAGLKFAARYPGPHIDLDKARAAIAKAGGLASS